MSQSTGWKPFRFKPYKDTVQLQGYTLSHQRFIFPALLFCFCQLVLDISIKHSKYMKSRRSLLNKSINKSRRCWRDGASAPFIRPSCSHIFIHSAIHPGRLLLYLCLHREHNCFQSGGAEQFAPNLLFTGCGLAFTYGPANYILQRIL